MTPRTSVGVIGRAAVAASVVVACVAPVAAPAAARSSRSGDDRPAVSWSVEPDPTGIAGERTGFGFVAAPGDTIDDTVRITNLGSTPVELDLYPADVVLGDGATIDMTRAADATEGVGDWIELPEDRVVVPAGEGVDLPFELHVPEDAAPGDRTGGIVTSRTTRGEDDLGRDVTTEMRLVARVQLRVTGAVDVGLEVSALDVDFEGSANPLGTGRATVSYVVTNTGNVRTAAGQVVRLRGLFGITGREATLADVPELLPGASIPVRVEIDGVRPAVRTTAQVVLRPRVGAVGDGEGPMVDEVTGASSAVTTFPWALVLVVVGLALGWWWRRRAHRRRIARAVDAALARVGAPDADGDAPVSPASRSGTTSDGCTRDTASSGRPVAPGSTRSR